MTPDASEKLAKIVIDKFKAITSSFVSHSCLDSKEDSIHDIYNDSNCYRVLSIDILRETEKTFPNITVIIGETSFYSYYNSMARNGVTISLGPLYFIIMQF
jgi:hypothetical protein